MAHAYTPGLKVSKETVVSKDRKLPLKGEVQVKEGDETHPEQVVARTELPGNVQPLNVANKLGIMEGETPDCMLKEEGDSVEEGEMIAETQGLFGWFKSHCESPVTGTIESISSVTGQVIFREEPIPVEVKAYIDGIVTEEYESEGVQIKSNASYLQGIFGFGGEVYGELELIVDDPGRVIHKEDIKEEHEDKIIVAGALITKEAFLKAVETGVNGVITGGFHYNDIKAILGHEIGVAITGSEDLGTTLLVTEGFGEMMMAPGTFELLEEKNGEKAAMNGATQIRAGVIRPEVVIPFGESDIEDTEEEEKGSGVEEGSLIRVIRAPYFGEIGKVVNLPAELQEMPSETMVRVLEAEFDDGETVTIPRANVEMIEG